MVICTIEHQSLKQRNYHLNQGKYCTTTSIYSLFIELKAAIIVYNQLLFFFFFFMEMTKSLVGFQVLNKVRTLNRMKRNISGFLSPLTFK